MGLSISVHDVYATQIELLNLDVFSAVGKHKLSMLGKIILVLM